MKLHILNDLHVEFDDFIVPKTDADVVILAGDIGVGMSGASWAAEGIRNKPVIYILGNHEYYHHDLSLINKMKSNSAENIHVLDNDELIIGDTRFLGCTLWTDFLLDGEDNQISAMRFAGRAMSDFFVINSNGNRFSPPESAEIHERSREWLNQKLATPFSGKTVVITHHAPSPMSLHPKFEGNLMNPAFISNLESLMDETRVQLWVHGHTHNSFDYKVAGTRVVCNPRGYSPKSVNKDFIPNLVVEI